MLPWNPLSYLVFVFGCSLWAKSVLFLGLFYSSYSLDIYSTVFRFFLRLIFFRFRSLLLGSSYFLGMMLLETIWWATLLLSLFPKLERVLDKISEVAVAIFLYSSYFFFLVFCF